MQERTRWRAIIQGPHAMGCLPAASFSRSLSNMIYEYFDIVFLVYFLILTADIALDDNSTIIFPEFYV